MASIDCTAGLLFQQEIILLIPDFRRPSRILACASSDMTGGET
jgi:hypothetical protein